MSDIREETCDSKGRYVLTVDGAEAEMTFSIASPTLRIVDHTGVPDALRGRGLAQKLGFIPLTYVSAMFNLRA